jgi:putative DNA primase/helicase
MDDQLHRIARALGGDVVGDQVAAPGPGHSHRDRSLSIKIGDNGNLLIHSFAQDDFRTCERHVRGLLGGAAPTSTGSPRPRIRKRNLADYARELRHGSHAGAGSLTNRYLARRGITVTSPIIRHHSNVKVPGERLWLPAMIAPVSAEDHRVIAVQVTYIDPATVTKAKIAQPRRTFGGLKDGAVRLARADDALCLAEGVETALSVMQLFEMPCWAVLGAQRFRRVAIPETVKRLHLMADADASATSLDQCEIAARQHRARGLNVLVHLPKVGKDFNDQLRGAA